MKKFKVLLILSFLCFTHICCQKDITQDIDITNFSWEIESIKTNHVKHGACLLLRNERESHGTGRE